MSGTDNNVAQLREDGAGSHQCRGWRLREPLAIATQTKVSLRLILGSSFTSCVAWISTSGARMPPSWSGRERTRRSNWSD